MTQVRFEYVTDTSRYQLKDLLYQHNNVLIYNGTDLCQPEKQILIKQYININVSDVRLMNYFNIMKQLYLQCEHILLLFLKLLYRMLKHNLFLKLL